MAIAVFKLFVGAFIAAGLAFWMLYFFVVLPKLGEANAMPKPPDRDFSFLITRWPSAELAAFSALLSPEQKSRWPARYVLNAGAIIAFLAVAALAAGAAIRLGL